MIWRLRLMAAGVVALGLGGCGQPLSWPDQINASSPDPIAVAPGTTIGQTFLAREAGLTGVDIYLTPQGAPHGTLNLELQPAPATLGAGTTLLTASLPAAGVTGPGFYHFAFAPQADSRLRSYYLRLAYGGAGQLLIGHGPPEAYQQGALYRNDGPDDGAQLAFRLDYDPLSLARAVAGQALTWLFWLALALLLFVVPGLALLAWLWPPAPSLSWGERLGLAAGLSVGLYPILFLATALIGLHLGWLYAVLPAGLGLVALGLWLARRWRLARPRLAWPDRRSPHLAPDLALAGLLALIVATRFWAARSLVAPLWGDSYHHTLITQLLIDHGGLFNSWAPYADLQTFTYHFGFHTLAAVFHWTTGLAAPDAVLWTGQILNILAVLTVYPLAVFLTHQRWAGVGAVLVAGLLSPTPMVYTDWGRYTELAGQVVLPVAVTLAWVVLSGGAGRRALVLVGLAMGGLALSHYRILIFAVIAIGAYGLLNLKQIRAVLPRIVAIGLIGGLIFLPWFIRIFGGQILAIFAREVSTASGSAAVADNNALSSTDLYPLWLWLAAGLALAAGLWRHDRWVALLGLWSFLVVLAANPQWLRLPGQGALSNFAVYVVAYLPLGLLIGAALGWLAAQLARQWPRLANLGLLLLVLVAGVWGAGQRWGDVQPGQYALVTWPDVRAADWIRARTPADGRFLVNSFFAYSGAVVVGSDAGWWLPELAGRATMLPPINYVFEQGDQPGYRQWINALPRAINTDGVGSAPVAQLLAARGINYVYLGQLRGAVNNPGAPVLDAGTLLATPGFQLVYHQDRVFIFRIAR